MDMFQSTPIVEAFMRKTSRPKIPAELRRRVLVEAGHRCAIPTCREIDVDVHHIIPWETVRKHDYSNLIALCPKCHRMILRGLIDRKALRMYKANLRFAIDKYSQFEMDLLFALSRIGPDDGLPFTSYMLLLIRRLLDSKFVEVHEVGDIVMVLDGINMNPVLLTITPQGREFMESLDKKNIGY